MNLAGHVNKMAAPEELSANMSDLNLIDPNGNAVLETANLVKLYVFDSEDKEWKKGGIEGELFVYTSNEVPHHTLLIINRATHMNFVEPVAQIIDLHLMETLLLYCNTNSNIFGILFYDLDECMRITALLDKLVRGFEINKNVQENQATLSYGENKPKLCERVGGLFSKFSKGPSHFGAGAQDGGLYICLQRKAHVEVAAKRVEQPLLNNPRYNPARNVEHTKKELQLGGGEPKKDDFRNPNTLEHFTKIKFQELEKISITIIFQRHTETQSSSTATSTTRTEKGFLRIVSTTAWPSVTSVVRSTRGKVKEMHTLDKLPLPFCGRTETPQKPTPFLMTPEMFTSSASKYATTEMQTTPVTSNAGAQLQLCPTPCAGLQGNASVPVGPQLPLSKYQLWQVFNYLVENDPEFVGQLNETYLKFYEEITM